MTPPGYAERAAAGLTASLHVVAPGQGHGIAGRGCLPDVIGDFVSAGTTAGLDTTCVGRLGPEPFFLDLLGPAP